MKSVADIFRSYVVLDENGRHTNGTDKESCHNYGDAYEQIFTHNTPQDDPGDVVAAYYPRSIRNDIKLMMEIGIADGSSLLAWSEIFPNAQCVGFDNHHSDRAHGNRIEFHLGDATNLDDCRRVAAGRLF